MGGELQKIEMRDVWSNNGWVSGLAGGEEVGMWVQRTMGNGGYELRTMGMIDHLRV